MPAPVRSRAFALVIGLLWSLALASDATAQARVEEKGNVTVTGDVVSVVPSARTITVQSTNDDGVVYQVDGAATIMSESQALALGDLKPGWNVVMNGHRVGNTKIVTYIKVVKNPTPGTTPAPAPAPTP